MRPRKLFDSHLLGAPNDRSEARDEPHINFHGGFVFGVVEYLADARSLDEAAEGAHPEKKDYDPALVRRAFAMLPAEEQDMIEMWIGRGKQQREIASTFNCSQENVSYRIRRAFERVRFYLDIGLHFTGDDIRRDLMASVRDLRPAGEQKKAQAEVEAFAVFWESGWCCRVAANRLRLSNVRAVISRIRYLREKVLPRLVQRAPDKYGKYLDALGAFLDAGQRYYNIGRVLPGRPGRVGHRAK